MRNVANHRNYHTKALDAPDDACQNPDRAESRGAMTRLQRGQMNKQGEGELPDLPHVSVEGGSETVNTGITVDEKKGGVCP